MTVSIRYKFQFRVFLMIFFSSLTSAIGVEAESVSPAKADRTQLIGHVEAAVGQVLVNGQAVTVGAPIYLNDHVAIKSTKSHVRIRFINQQELRIRGAGSLTMERYLLREEASGIREGRGFLNRLYKMTKPLRDDGDENASEQTAVIGVRG